MNKPANSAPAVDLVIIIDTSPSMKDEARSLSDAAASAIAKAKSSCPSDLRVVWLGIESIWKGTNFDQTIRNYLTQIAKVSESKLRGRKIGTVKSAGAQEDGARAIEDIAEHFNWRKDAARAIFYLGDEALEGGGDKTEQKDIQAADLAIEKAQKAGVTVHTYFGISNSKHQEGIKAEYARISASTGGQSFTDKDAISGFSAVLEKVICGSRTPNNLTPTTTAKTVKLQPGAVYIQDCVSNELSKLYTLDLVTGKASFIGEIVTEVADIAFVNSHLYGLDREGEKTRLVKIDLNSGDATVIGDIGFAAAGLAYNRQRQTLYATTAKQLIAINLDTAKGTPVVTVADKEYNCGEVAFNAEGKAYITLIGYDKKKILASTNLDTGEVKKIGEIGFADVASMEFVGDVLYGVTGNFFNLGKDGQLIRIDTKTGKGTLVAITEPVGRWAGISLYEPVTAVTTAITSKLTSEEQSEKIKVSQEIKTVKEGNVSILTIDTKNNCYVIDANQMNNLQQNIASSYVFEKGSYDIKITGGRYSYAKIKTEGEPFVLLWIYGVDGSTFINKNTGFEVGATWTTLNGYNDNLRLEVKDKAVLNALFFDVNKADNGGSINLLINSNKPYFTPQTLTVDSKRNCYILDEQYLSSLQQSGANFVELAPGNYRLRIREGNASYWSDSKKFNIEPWALIWLNGGKTITKLTGIEVTETWISLNGLKDEAILEVKEKTTLTGLFFDTYKEDNEGQIILAIESVSVSELTERYQKQEKTVTNGSVTNVTTETVTTIHGNGGGNAGGSVSREAVGATAGRDFTFRFNNDEFKQKWEQQLQQINASIKVIDQTDVTLEAKYWDQLEQWLLKNYEKHFKNLSVEVAKVRFSMDAYIQQMEFSLNQHLQGWSSYLDRLLEERINVEISNRINQQINQYVDQTFEQRIRNNIGLIINNIVNKQELNQYIDRHVNQQIDQTFEQRIRNNVSLIINNLVNKQELNQYIDQHVNQQVDQTFEQKINNNVELIINKLVNKQELNQYIDQHVNQQVDQTFEQKINNNVDSIVNSIVNKQELNQYIDNQVNQRVDQTFEQKIQNNINLITQNIVANNTEINQYVNQQIDHTFEDKLQNNIELIVNNIINKQELNQYIGQHVEQHLDQSFEAKIRNNIKLITQNLITNNTELSQYFNQEIDNSFEQKIQNHIQAITQNIINDNDVLNHYLDQRVQQTVNHNTEVNHNIVNIVANSQEINSKIENIRNEWNDTFINLVTQQVDELINIIGGREAFIKLITQNVVNNNAEINQYVNQQIDNTYEQKVQNYVKLITQNIVNNNELLNQYVDQRVHHNVTNNNVVIKQIFDNEQITQKIQHIFNDNTQIHQKIESVVINSTEINNKILNFVVNSTEISNKINNVYKDIDIKIENVRNEWNQAFITLVRQYVNELINIIGDNDTFNLRIANAINIKVDELLNQVLRIRNELTVIINNADRHLYEWTLGELMAIKGCLTDRQALVEQLVTFSSELRVKLDNTNCVDINTFKPFKPLSTPQPLPGNK
ncbi:hypothetical protein H6G41_15685 [Tolypothrix sp. FACHB-123]|uniref:YncE family protein n=1 Tax=Tolypothrix sp. FACHB-123 TaxID=2692868 RepID=UPI001685E9C5|nr:hypothetical protein [Tolypothrix sp. FACHB-123]MBD2356046.1 hypothetical protein [Tolypothrix sp. FACHB-123]